MLKQARPKDQERILSFLGKKVESCLYLYLDIYYYGLSSDVIKVWIDEDVTQQIRLVVMNYCGTFQIYSVDNKLPVEEIKNLASQEKIERIFSNRSVIEVLEPVFFENWVREYGSVIEVKHHRDFKEQYKRIKVAKKEEIPEIVSLLRLDEENNRAYSHDELQKTLTNIYESGIGRSFILREDDRIVATVSVTAEADLFVVGAYTMVHPEYRNTLYGMLMDSYLYYVARGEKRLFGFVTSSRRIRMFQALGNTVVEEYGKLIHSAF